MMKYINEHIDKVYTMNKYIKHVKESSNINAYLMILPRTSNCIDFVDSIDVFVIVVVVVVDANSYY